MTWSRGTAVLSAVGAAFLGSVAVAQEDPQLNDEPVPQAKKNVEFKVSGGGMHMFETNIDSGGDVEVSRFSLGINAKSQIERDLELNLGASFLWSEYNFSGDTALGGPDPWTSVQTLDLSAIFNWGVSDDWTIFGGPIFGFSRESGADFGDSFTGGGLVGASFVAGPDLVLGGGFGMTTRLEDSLRVFPVIVVEWQITNDVRLSSSVPAMAGRTIGMELVYDLGGGWETALGGGYEFHRFRLDDDGQAPEGVGQDTSIPFWVRLTYGTDDNFRLNFMGGFVGTGELNLDSNVGTPITEENYDAAFIVGASASIAF
ncbi:MAG: hypothetical protein JSV91_03435 [Phycisphaerales bacterium]|nr:MAG: hypothetical protein JSV91_03435 [Phycisphaerales bacterium]